MGCSTVGPFPDERRSERRSAGVDVCPSTPALLATALRVGAADDAHLYGFAPGALVRVPLGGGPAEPVVTGLATDRADDLVVDGASVSFVTNEGLDDGTIRRAPKSGGAARAIVSSKIPRRLVAAGDALYYVTGEDELWTLPSGAGEAVRVRSGLRRSSLLSATSEEVVFYESAGADSDDRDMRLAAVPLAGAPVTVVDQAAATLAVSTADAFHVAPTTNVDLLVRASRATGARTTVYSPALYTGLERLRSDGGMLYVATSAGQLLRMREDGTDVTPLVDGGVEGQFVIAGDSVYFNRAGDAYRVCK